MLNLVILTCCTNNQQQYGSNFERVSLHWLALTCLCWELYVPFPPKVKKKNISIRYIFCNSYYIMFVLLVCEHFEGNKVPGYQRLLIKLWVGDPLLWLVPNID